jgi:hypothetical protein
MACSLIFQIFGGRRIGLVQLIRFAPGPYCVPDIRRDNIAPSGMFLCSMITP